MLLARVPKAMIGVLPNAPFMGGSEGASGAVGGNAPFRGGCSYSSVKRDSSFRWAFSAALTQARPGLRSPPALLRPLVHGFGIQAQFCAAFRYRPARRDDVVGGPSGLGRTASHAPDDRHRSSSAACLWLQWARQAAGIGRWRVSAGRRGGRPPP